ncbi:MAG: polyprenyl synthetase family protein [Polyangiaceae bacterium]|nr:polyprenyl synthetase family protein [Polyangiaceae bacterium]
MRQPLLRIDEIASQAIASLESLGATAAWKKAVESTLAVHQSPKHQLRAQLVLLGSMAGGGSPSGVHIEQFAAGVELLHLFMLVLDDVMDNATLRRNKPALRISLQQAEPSSGWQTARDLATVVASTLSMVAVQKMTPPADAPAGMSKAFHIMLNACVRAGAGQFQDLLGFKAISGGEAGLRSAVLDKTAHHSFAAPFAAGLVIANPNASTESAMTWGEHIGVAFQTTDDLTDLLSPATLTGKDALQDLLLGRPSLPLLLLRERLNEDDLAFVDSIVGKQVVAVGERGALLRIIEQSGIASACAERIRTEIAAAAKVADLAGFPSAAREGMKVFEDNLLVYANKVIAESASS